MPRKIAAASEPSTSIPQGSNFGGPSPTLGSILPQVPHHSRTEPSISNVSAMSEMSKEYRTKTARPYRSHKYPACARCHKRRSRCTIETPGSACLLCRMHNVPCSSASAKRDERSMPKVGFIHRSLLPDPGSYLDEPSHVVGPVIARDTQILENYLEPMLPPTQDSVTPRNTPLPQMNSKPIYHVPIPPRRPSPAQQCSCSRNLPLELINQVDAYFEKLVGMYFEHLYPAFPVIEEQCLILSLGDRTSIPRTFLVNFVAYVLFYWNLGPELLLHVKPDQDFAWQVAVQAMMVDSQKGDIASIIAIILNVAGRPSKGFISNMTSVSRIVALSHSCGLNHDCREWKIHDSQKKLRWKIWWAILIHDRWLNFAQGTPPYINKAHYDVPMPTVELIAANRINILKHYRAAECYIELCRLTEIIGDVLPLIYHIRSGNDGLAAEQTSRSEIELNRWHQSRPKWLDYHSFDHRPTIPGLTNLQFSYLAVRMLLRRIAWHEVCQREPNPKSFWLENCLEAAENIVLFARSLQPVELAGFWLPCNAHHFTSAVTLLIRCGLQTGDLHVRRRSMQSARALVDCLRRYKDEYNWDMAETALVQSESILKRIEDALPKTPSSVHSMPPVPLPAHAHTHTSISISTPMMTMTTELGPGSGHTGHSHASLQMQSSRSNSATVTAVPAAPTSISTVDDAFWDNPMLQYQGFGWHGQPEELFPGVFSDLNADSMLFESLTQMQQY